MPVIMVTAYGDFENEAQAIELVYCIIDISPNNLYKFPSAALSSIAVARYGSFFRLAD